MAHHAGISQEFTFEVKLQIPKWKQVFSKDYPEAKVYDGDCTHEDAAFLVDPLKLILEDWEKWAKEDLPKEIEEQYAAQGAVPLRLKVYTGTEKVFFGLIEYPAVRVESWHHGSGGIVLVIAAIIGLIIVVWAFLAWLFTEAEEIPWVIPLVGVGAAAIGLLLLLALVPKKKEVE